MQLVSQISAIEELTQLASQNKHSILIEGSVGCGKSYLANMYADLLHIADIAVQYIAPNVNAIKDAVDACITIQTPVLLCIENLDTGVPAAAYTILKFLEEPTEHVYIIVTCRNIKHVPDTIISRSAVVNVAPPIQSDLLSYAKLRDAQRVTRLMSTKIWRCASTFSDIDYVMSLSDAQLDYFENSYTTHMKFSDSVSNLSWSLTHFADNSEIPAEFAIRFLLSTSYNEVVKSACIQALKDLASARIGVHAVICKLLFECKYGGG